MAKNVLPIEPYMTDAVIATLMRSYEGLGYDTEVREDQLQLSLNELSPRDREALALDLRFFAQNPNVPLENICCRLSNFEPKNGGHEELLKYADMLLNLDDPIKAAGLYVWGDPGVGKSHLTIAMAKEFMRRGLDAHFTNADDLLNKVRSGRALKPGQVWVIDDLNSGYAVYAGEFTNLVLHIHNKGGRLFVTSNQPYETFVEQRFGASASAEANRMRYDDRTRAMFKILRVTGESQRQADAWYAEA